MRILVDVQACQSAAVPPGAAAWCVNVLRELLRQAEASVELVLLASRVLGDAAAPALAALADGRARLVWFEAPAGAAACRVDGAWARAAGRLARESVVDACAADALIVLDAALGHADDALVSVGRLAATPTLALLPSGLPQSARAEHRAWRREVLADLARADAVYLAPGQPFDESDDIRCAALPVDPADAAARLLAHAARLAARPRAPAAAPARPRLAYVSPLPPAASGIADYSAELLPALAEHYDVELVPTGPTPPAASFTAPYPVREPAWFLEHAGRYDRVVYQFGNSPFHREMVGLLRLVPGTAVVHDFYLGHLYAHVQHSGHAPMALRRAVLRSHGLAALRCLRDEGEGAVLARYPCNFEIFGQADGVIVHSQHARELARQWYGDALPCRLDVVPHPRRLTPATPEARAAARRRLGVSRDTLLVCSFGYAGAAKLSRELVEAWLGSGLARGRLVLVGGHQFDDPYRDALEARVRESASVEITGYVSAGLYQDYLAAADIAVQLRTRSRGETSGAILDAMAHGAALIVNAHGSAAELPAETVYRLQDDCSVAQIAAALRRLGEDEALRGQLTAAARAHVQAVHEPAQVARDYRDAIEAAAREAPRTPAGRARAVRAALAATPAPGRAPSRAELARFAGQLLRNHPQPGHRPVPVDFGAAALVEAPAHLRMLTLFSADTPAPARARHVALACADAGMAVRELRVAPEAADAHALVQAALRREQPDVVQLADLALWPALRDALDAIALRRERPALVCAVAPSGDASAMRELARRADLLLGSDEAARLALVDAGAPVDRVEVLATGAGGFGVGDPRMLAACGGRPAHGPYALILADDEPEARAGIQALVGPSLAFLPPHTELWVAGAVSRGLADAPWLARWSAVNHSRVRLLGPVDEDAAATLLRHARVLVLPGASRASRAWPPAHTDAWVLATPAALGHLPAGLARAPIVEDDWARLRMRLVELLEHVPPEGEAMPGWQTTMAWLPARVRAAVHCRRRFAAEPGTGESE